VSAGFERDAERIAAIALAEDGPRDITSDVTVAPGVQAVGRIEYRSGGMVAGRSYADAVAQATGCAIKWDAGDGEAVGRGTTIGRLTGSLAQVLRAERPLLNLLQRACGIATTTRTYVAAVTGTHTRILHTRSRPQEPRHRRSARRRWQRAPA
jgi:nicotinate-nucleotide pyrophosphorylase (carboxylating)